MPVPALFRLRERFLKLLLHRLLGPGPLKVIALNHIHPQVAHHLQRRRILDEFRHCDFAKPARNLNHGFNKNLIVPIIGEIAYEQAVYFEYLRIQILKVAKG